MQRGEIAEDRRRLEQHAPGGFQRRHPARGVACEMRRVALRFGAEVDEDRRERRARRLQREMDGTIREAGEFHGHTVWS